MTDATPRRRRAQAPAQAVKVHSDAPDPCDTVQDAAIPEDTVPDAWPGSILLPDMPAPQGSFMPDADASPDSTLPENTLSPDLPDTDFYDEQPVRQSLFSHLGEHIAYMALPSRPRWRVHSLGDFINWVIDWLAFPLRMLGAFCLYWLRYARSAIRYFFEPLSSRVPVIRRSFWLRAGRVLLVLLAVLGLVGAIALAQPLLLLLCLLPLPMLIWRCYSRRKRRKQLRELQARGIHLQLPIDTLIPLPTKPNAMPMQLLFFQTVHPRTGTPISLFSDPVHDHFAVGELVHVILHPTDEDIYHIDVSTPVPKRFSFPHLRGKRKGKHAPSQRTIQRKLRRTMNTATPERVKK